MYQNIRLNECSLVQQLDPRSRAPPDSNISAMVMLFLAQSLLLFSPLWSASLRSNWNIFTILTVISLHNLPACTVLAV